MKTSAVYRRWAPYYDSNENKTRDLEEKVMKKYLRGRSFSHVLELGCGTGKNTRWLVRKAAKVTSVDFSAEMLAVARSRIRSARVRFITADITRPWKFAGDRFDLIIFSLVLEHIKDLDAIFRKARKSLNTGGQVYIGELHPFRQYKGSRARVTIGNREWETTCYVHHLSDFTRAALKSGFVISDVQEHFDAGASMPRILSLTLRV